MFQTYYDGYSLDLSHFDTAEVKNMSGMFEVGTISSGLENWDVSSVTNMSGMFYVLELTDISDIDLSNWNVSNVTNMSWMFRDSVISTDIGIENWDVSNATYMASMFLDATIDTNIDLSGWDVLNVTDYEDFDNVNEGNIIPPIWENAYLKIYSETDKSIRIYNDVNVPSVGDEYRGRTVTKVYNMSDGTGNSSCDTTTVVPTSIVVEDNVSPLSLSFSGCTKVNYVNVSKMDVSNATSLSSMFKNVGSDSSVTTFTILGLDKWDTSSVRNMHYMFYNMGKNANYTLDLSDWDVSNVRSWSRSNFDYGVTDKITDPLWK